MHMYRWRSSGLPWSQEDFLAQTAESKTMQSEIQARSPLTLHPRADAPSHADTHTHTHFRALSPGASVSSSASLSSLETEDEIDVLVRVTLELLEEGEEEGDIFPLLY